VITVRAVAAWFAALVAVFAVAAGVSMGLERLFLPDIPTARDANPAITAGSRSLGHINATLYYATRDGGELVGVTREVPLGDGRTEQGRQIVMLALTPPPFGYVSPIPRGTTLRAFYLTDGGDAYVDLSQHASSAHPGGTAAELLTVWAIVNDVTANLPAVRRVQILIEGQTVDTLAGHVDLRRPLARDTSLVRATP
jgi:spore germination protein GerM